MEEMIAMTDVFIFDCDGVIWRVSVYNTHNLKFVF
jgi:ribonucleotide monophosphatase NagD (HAD superfamily)